jgi:hypothetical protein
MLMRNHFYFQGLPAIDDEPQKRKKQVINNKIIIISCNACPSFIHCKPFHPIIFLAVHQLMFFTNQLRQFSSGS